MTGSMYASIGGLKTHMQKLSVIGNNVANVNTQGYKKQRTVFRDTVYSSYRNGSDGTQTVGGKNPSQLGYGSQIGSIDLDMSSTVFNPGKPTDCAIVGDGFFLVGNKDVAEAIDPTNPDSFKSLNLTRVGDISEDPNGYFTDGTGKCVYGFLCVGVDEATGKPIISDQLVPLRLPRMERVPVDIKTGQEITENLDTDTGKPTTGTEGVDWKYKEVLRWPVYKDEGGGGANPPANPDANANNFCLLQDYQKKAADGEVPDPLPKASLDAISIDEKTGCISGTTKDTGEHVVIGYIAIGNVSNPNGVTHIGESYYTAGAGAGDLNITMMGGVAKELMGVDGKIGSIVNVNGSVAKLYTEAPGDANQGNGDPADALPAKSLIRSAGETKLMSGFLEGPNVDLAEEIAELITTQRGYQANTRIVTVTDSMLEELVNMKR